MTPPLMTCFQINKKISMASDLAMFTYMTAHMTSSTIFSFSQDRNLGFDSTNAQHKSTITFSSHDPFTPPSYLNRPRSDMVPLSCHTIILSATVLLCTATRMNERSPPLRCWWFMKYASLTIRSPHWPQLSRSSHTSLAATC